MSYQDGSCSRSSISDRRGRASEGIPSSREKLMMEKKIASLEQRLGIVERFVEIKFCETFRDFTIRSFREINGDDEDDDGGSSRRHGNRKDSGPRSRKRRRPTDSGSSSTYTSDDGDGGGGGGGAGRRKRTLMNRRNVERSVHGRNAQAQGGNTEEFILSDPLPPVVVPPTNQGQTEEKNTGGNLKREVRGNEMTSPVERDMMMMEPEDRFPEGTPRDPADPLSNSVPAHQNENNSNLEEAIRTESDAILPDPPEMNGNEPGRNLKLEGGDNQMMTLSGEQGMIAESGESLSKQENPRDHDPLLENSPPPTHDESSNLDVGTHSTSILPDPHPPEIKHQIVTSIKSQVDCSDSEESNSDENGSNVENVDGNILEGEGNDEGSSSSSDKDKEEEEEEDEGEAESVASVQCVDLCSEDDDKSRKNEKQAQSSQVPPNELRTQAQPSGGNVQVQHSIVASGFRTLTNNRRLPIQVSQNTVSLSTKQGTSKDSASTPSAQTDVTRKTHVVTPLPPPSPELPPIVDPNKAFPNLLSTTVIGNDSESLSQIEIDDGRTRGKLVRASSLIPEVVLQEENTESIDEDDDGDRNESLDDSREAVDETQSLEGSDRGSTKKESSFGSPRPSIIIVPGTQGSPAVRCPNSSSIKESSSTNTAKVETRKPTENVNQKEQPQKTQTHHRRFLNFTSPAIQRRGEATRNSTPLSRPSTSQSVVVNQGSSPPPPPLIPCPSAVLKAQETSGGVQTRTSQNFRRNSEGDIDLSRPPDLIPIKDGSGNSKSNITLRRTSPIRVNFKPKPAATPKSEPSMAPLQVASAQVEEDDDDNNKGTCGRCGARVLKKHMARHRRSFYCINVYDNPEVCERMKGQILKINQTKRTAKLKNSLLRRRRVKVRTAVIPQRPIPSRLASQYAECQNCGRMIRKNNLARHMKGASCVVEIEFGSVLHNPVNDEMESEYGDADTEQQQAEDGEVEGNEFDDDEDQDTERLHEEDEGEENGQVGIEEEEEGEPTIDLEDMICKYEDCAFIPVDEREYKKHLELHPLNRGVNCPGCGKLFYEKLNMLDHAKGHLPSSRQNRPIHPSR